MTRWGPRFVLIPFFVLLLVCVALAGCATTSPYPGQAGGHTYHAQETGSRPDFGKGRAVDPASLPKAPDTRPLPDITRDEIEQLGDRLFNNGDFHMAFVQYEKYLSLDPGNVRVWYKKGLVLLAADLNQDAVKEFEALSQAHPRYAPAYEGLGQAHFRMKQYPEAEKHLQKALEIDPNLWKSHNYLGTLYDRQQRYDEAVREYVAAIGLKPELGLLYHNLGVSYYLAGSNQDAIHAFQKAIDKNHTRARTYNSLGLAYARAGQYQEALDAFTKGGTKAKAYNNLGCFFLAEGKYKKAISCFEKAIEMSPECYAQASDNLRIARIGYERGEGL